MPYRFHTVIPSDFDSTVRERRESFPAAVRFSLKENEKDCVEGNVEKKFSRSTMSYTICTIAASMVFVAAGLPFLGQTGMTWWLWATFPTGGAVLGLLVLIWRGGKDDDSRRATGWKAIFGMVGGVGAPRIWMLIHPAITESTFMSDPIVLGVLGFLCFLGGSGAAAGVMRYWDKDAPRVGYQQTKRTVKKFTQTTDKLEP